MTIRPCLQCIVFGFTQWRLERQVRDGFVFCMTGKAAAVAKRLHKSGAILVFWRQGIPQGAILSRFYRLGSGSCFNIKTVFPGMVFLWYWWDGCETVSSLWWRSLYWQNGICILRRFPEGHANVKYVRLTLERKGHHINKFSSFPKPGLSWWKHLVKWVMKKSLSRRPFSLSVV